MLLLAIKRCFVPLLFADTIYFLKINIRILTQFFSCSGNPFFNATSPQYYSSNQEQAPSFQLSFSSSPEGDVFDS